MLFAAGFFIVWQQTTGYVHGFPFLALLIGLGHRLPDQVILAVSPSILGGSNCSSAILQKNVLSAVKMNHPCKTFMASLS